MIERAAAGASLELKGASAHASLCLRLMRSPPKVTIPERSNAGLHRLINARAWRKSAEVRKR